VRGMWAPPYLSSDFLFEIRLFGEIVKADKYVWSPREMQRQGAINDIHVESTFTLADGCRGAVMAVTLPTQARTAVSVPLQINITGTFAHNEVWDFFKQQSKPTQWDDSSREALFSEKDGAIVWGNDAGAIVMRTSMQV